MAAVAEIAGERQVKCRDFPFGLGRQALVGPAGEGVSLVETDMANRLGGDDRALARHGGEPPPPVLPAPIHRRPPTPPLDPGPTPPRPQLHPPPPPLPAQFPADPPNNTTAAH